MAILRYSKEEELKAAGRREGREEGVYALVDSYMEDNMPESVIISKLVRRFGLTLEAAAVYLKKYNVDGNE